MCMFPTQQHPLTEPKRGWRARLNDTMFTNDPFWITGRRVAPVVVAAGELRASLNGNFPNKFSIVLPIHSYIQIWQFTRHTFAY